jgi:hypothetical protein
MIQPQGDKVTDAIPQLVQPVHQFVCGEASSACRVRKPTATPSGNALKLNRLLE